MAYEGDMDDPNANMGTQAEATGTSIGGYDAGGAPGGPSDIGAVAAAAAAAQGVATADTGGWDFPDPVGGWATSAPPDSTDTTGQDSQASAPQNPLDSAMAIVDAAIANTGMPALGLPGMGVQGFGFTDAQNQAYGQDQGGMTAGVGLSGTTGDPGIPGSGGGWGADITGPGYADPNMTAFDASQYGMLSTPQQAHANIPSYAENMQTMYGADQGGAGVGLEAYDSSLPGRGWGQGIADVAAQQDQTAFGADQGGASVGLTGSPVGAAQSGDVGIGGYGDQGGYTGWGANITAPPAPENTVDPGLQQALDAQQDSTAPLESMATEEHDVDKDYWDDLTEAEKQESYDARQQALDNSRTETTSQLQADVKAMRNALKDQPPIDDLVEDEDEDLSGMPIDPETGKAITVEAFMHAYISLQNMRDYDGNYAVSPERAKALLDSAIARTPDFVFDAIDAARAALPFGLAKGPATTQERMDAAVANIQADIDATAMEMDVSTGEDHRAIRRFQAKYPWAQKMSDFEVQAYINSPELLKLKLDNMKITEQMNTNTALSSNDIRALWAPAGAGLPGAGQQSASLYPQG